MEIHASLQYDGGLRIITQDGSTSGSSIIVVLIVCGISERVNGKETRTDSKRGKRAQVEWT